MVSETTAMSSQMNTYDICLFLLWCPGCPRLFCDFEANVYFLFVSIIVCLPDGPMMWSEAPREADARALLIGAVFCWAVRSSTVVPFIGVLLWTAFKDRVPCKCMQMLYDLIRIISHHAWDMWNSNRFARVGHRTDGDVSRYKNNQKHA